MVTDGNGCAGIWGSLTIKYRYFAISAKDDLEGVIVEREPPTLVMDGLREGKRSRMIELKTNCWWHRFSCLHGARCLEMIVDQSLETRPARAGERASERAVLMNTLGEGAHR